MPKAAPVRSITVLIVDDHDILRYGIRSLLGNHAEVEVVGEADSVAQAIARAAALLPDVVLMDALLPDGSGIDACREILSARPQTRVLFFSAQADEQTVVATLLAGAQGHISKDVEVAVLVDAIKRVAGGGSVIDERVRSEVLALLESSPRAAETAMPAEEALSPQEERVMTLVVEGKTNKQIALAIGLSEKTVKNYLYNAFQKLGVGRRAHAATIFDFKRLQRARRLLSDGPRGKPQ